MTEYSKKVVVGNKVLICQGCAGTEFHPEKVTYNRVYGWEEACCNSCGEFSRYTMNGVSIYDLKDYFIQLAEQRKQLTDWEKRVESVIDGVIGGYNEIQSR